MTFVNSHLRQRQETERLRNIIARIESYEPVVRRDVYIVSYLGHHIGVLAISVWFDAAAHVLHFKSSIVLLFVRNGDMCKKNRNDTCS